MDRIVYYQDRIIFCFCRAVTFYKCFNSLTFEGESKKKNNDILCCFGYLK